eukprot:7508506-Karenia_brevis.AAC.1
MNRSVRLSLEEVIAEEELRAQEARAQHVLGVHAYTAIRDVGRRSGPVQPWHLRGPRPPSRWRPDSREVPRSELLKTRRARDGGSLVRES